MIRMGLAVVDRLYIPRRPTMEHFHKNVSVGGRKQIGEEVAGSCCHSFVVDVQAAIHLRWSKRIPCASGGVSRMVRSRCPRPSPVSAIVASAVKSYASGLW
jgi:hypothetical protein